MPVHNVQCFYSSWSIHDRLGFEHKKYIQYLPCFVVNEYIFEPNKYVCVYKMHQLQRYSCKICCVGLDFTSIQSFRFHINLYIPNLPLSNIYNHFWRCFNFRVGINWVLSGIQNLQKSINFTLFHGKYDVGQI